MNLTESHRAHLADLIWFEPENPFEAIEEPIDHAPTSWSDLRPFSLATRAAAEIMGLHILDEDTDLTPEQEQREMQAYLWLHSAPIPEVCGAMWSNAWQALLAVSVEVNEPMLALFRRYRARLIMAHSAVVIRVLPKPPTPHDKTPSSVTGPLGLAPIMGILLAETHLPKTELLWHTWLPQALALYHRAVYWHGAWTIYPGNEVNENAFEDTDLMPEELRGALDLRENKKISD